MRHDAGANCLRKAKKENGNALRNKQFASVASKKSQADRKRNRRRSQLGEERAKDTKKSPNPCAPCSMLHAK